jgi:hypothetical protein
LANMQQPTHNGVAFGKGGIVDVDKDHYCLIYGDWYLSINAVGLLQCNTLFDNSFLVSSSLVHVKEGGFSSGGEAAAKTLLKQYEPFEVVKFYKRTAYVSDIHYSTNSRRLLKINNVGQKISFLITPLGTEGIPPDMSCYVHFSLFKAK